jgi:hypothetical protein
MTRVDRQGDTISLSLSFTGEDPASIERQATAWADAEPYWDFQSIIVAPHTLPGKPRTWWECTVRMTRNAQPVQP